jgi:hypothetical protein
LTRRVLWLLPAARTDRLCTVPTLDVDATEVVCYGSGKDGIAYNYQGQLSPDARTW